MATHDTSTTTQIARAGTRALAVRSSALVARGLRDLARDSNWLIKKVFTGRSQHLAVSSVGQVCAISEHVHHGTAQVALYDIELSVPTMTLAPPAGEVSSSPEPGAVFSWSPNAHYLAGASSAWPSGLHVHGVREKLSTRPSSYARCGKLDGAADADVGHAPTQVACHHCIDVLVSWIWIILEQGSRLHDLAGLAVAALRNLQIDPCRLQRMAPIGIKSFDGRDFGAGDSAHRGDARPGRATFDMDGAGAAHPDATTKLGPGEAELVADHP